jgi:hypothetical protein
MQFSGTFFDKGFAAVEADSLEDLFSKVSTPGYSMDQVRCFCSAGLQPDGRPFWLESRLGIPAMFEAQLGAHIFDEGFRTLFANRNGRSPNSTPDNSPATDDDIPIVSAEVPDEIFTGDKLALCINEVCPFSQEEVKDTKDPLLFIEFDKGNGTTEKICVSLEYFEAYVRSENDEGKEIVGLHLANIQCKGEGEARSFHLSEKVWVGSVLNNSSLLRKSFVDLYSCAVKRRNELLILKETKDLWSRILFWISDFYVFSQDEGAAKRLQTPTGRCHFMTKFYFTKVEAKRLGRRLMPNSVPLRIALDLLIVKRAGENAATEAADSHEVCTAHDIAPLLVTCFGVKNYFTRKKYHNKEEFKRKKQEWIVQGGREGGSDVRFAL